MIIYKPENSNNSNVWYYVLDMGKGYLLMGFNNRYHAERIIHQYATKKAAINKAFSLNLKTGAERG